MKVRMQEQTPEQTAMTGKTQPSKKGVTICQTGQIEDGRERKGDKTKGDGNKWQWSTVKMQVSDNINKGRKETRCKEEKKTQNLEMNYTKITYSDFTFSLG